ncbi:divergent polysaccharide deacetylase family protein [Psychromonas sp. 14N.309.X.WAT.B.A12]|uniref:divergent polysaccharide deacetylase family protein n=1 Tax=unclassified Psychromonas TaxID=2614957 RepID=UPI0025B0DAB1|nr:divergent polysaccharide deacetylase family protein [Psychromonas sp. 14N.309.X.WAT.B.A12]MDN2664570.1 divergent polysaccharide deacetylase family protein [Psychromonas sp. 14N.309.X.WAT.B.A12]
MLYIGLISYSTSTLASSIGKIAIIIDDIGYNRHNQAFLKLPKAITFAILPFTPYSTKIANLAHQQSREVLLHIPMQAHSHNHLLGKGALMEQMTKHSFQHTLSGALDDIPYAIGVNNHMGSKLTEETVPMQWTMDLLSQHGLFFVDSLTSAKSVAAKTAIAAGLPALKRHIFLDNVRTPEAMDKQFDQAIKHSLTTPYTILIGHPYPETLSYLSQRLGAPNKDFQLVKLSQLIPEKQRMMLDQKKVQYDHQHLLYPEVIPIILNK